MPVLKELQSGKETDAQMEKGPSAGVAGPALETGHRRTTDE